MSDIICLPVIDLNQWDWHSPLKTSANFQARSSPNVHFNGCYDVHYQSSPTIQPVRSRYSPYGSFRGRCRGRLQSPPTRNCYSPDFNGSPPSHPRSPSIFQSYQSKKRLNYCARAPQESRSPDLNYSPPFQSYQPRKRIDYRARAPQQRRRPKGSCGSQFRRAAYKTFVRNSVSIKNAASGSRSPVLHTSFMQHS